MCSGRYRTTKCRRLRDKAAAKTAVGLRKKVLDKVKSEFGNPDITSILTDDSGEFKGTINYSNRAA